MDDSTTMEATGQSYTKFENNDYDINGIPLQSPPPYSLHPPPPHQHHLQPHRQPQSQPHSQESSTTVVASQRNTVIEDDGPSSNCLWMSICSFFFFPPMSICAIAFSIMSMNAANAGDYPTARDKARTAALMAMCAIVIGVVIYSTAVIVSVVISEHEMKHTDDDIYNKFD